MAEHPNAVMARQMADALSRGDMQALAGVPCRPAEGHGSPDDTTSDHYPDADEFMLAHSIDGWRDHIRNP